MTMDDLKIRRMRQDQLGEVSSLADEIYPDSLYESYLAIYSRWHFFPQGSIVLLSEQHDLVCGYSFFHPWEDGEIVQLNTVLEGVPNSKTAYLHDLAIMPELRGNGFGVDLTLNVLERIRSQGFRRCSLVSVLNTSAFWEQFGFTKTGEITYGTEPGYKMSMLITG